VSDSIPAAAACLDQIPESTRWVERLIDHPHAPLRAKARLHERHPCQPPYQLEITTFGRFSIRRSDGGAVSDRVRGGR
jgi:hypothetical protein